MYSVAVLLFLLVGAVYADEAELPEIAGIFGMDSTGGEAWLAVIIDIPEGFALAGFDWYNNDEHIVFPEVLVGTGYENSPGPVADFLVVAENVQGGSSNWSSIAFDQPVVPSLGGLYVAISMPAGATLAGIGAGGGPGFGYYAGNEGARGWLSGEGEIWAHLDSGYQFAVSPAFVTAEEGMAVKSMDGDEIPPLEPFLTAGPNPFNPAIEIRFGLDADAMTGLCIYDSRGRLVCELLCEYLSAGNHEIAWGGRDSRGCGVASGVYILRLESGDVHFSRKLTLVK